MATLTFGGKHVVHPDAAIEAAERNDTPTDFIGRANSFTCPRGKRAGVAWLLMLRSDVDALDTTAAHTLSWSDGTHTLSVPSLYIDRTYTLNRALRSDPNALVLVRALDRRAFLMMSDIDAQYNVRNPAPQATSGVSLYYSESRNSGALWTWQTMLDDIWSNLPASFAGLAPTLPAPAPHGSPEGFRFIGVSAWDALFVVLDKLRLSLVYNCLDGSFDYADPGAAQSGLAAAKQALSNAGCVIFDFDNSPILSTAIPETIRVYFWRREQFHGIEEDTVEFLNWEMTPASSVDWTVTAVATQPDTILPVWDDSPLLVDTGGLIPNGADLIDRAEYIGAQIETQLTNGDTPQKLVYAGIITDSRILPGNEVAEIRWSDSGDGRGMITELIQGNDRETTGSTETSLAYLHRSAGGAGGLMVAGEHIASGDIGRNQYPLYPRVSQAVQVDDDLSSTGANLTANASGLFPGYVIRFIGAGTYEQLDPCWIRPLDLQGTSETALSTVKQKDRFHGRLYGVDTDSGDTRPVYLVRAGSSEPSEIRWGVAIENWTDNGSACDHVRVNECDDCEGANPQAATLTVLLPKHSDDDGQDPNVTFGAVIAFAEAADGSLVCTSDYLDHKIGDVIMRAVTGGVRPGWALMDGSANSMGNGGSGVNVQTVETEDGSEAPFIRYGTPGVSGGRRKHKHEGSISIDISIDAFLDLGQVLTDLLGDGFRVLDHTVTDLLHVHSYFLDTAKLQGTGSSFQPIYETQPCTGNPVGGVHEAAGDSCPSGDWGPLEHTVVSSFDGGAYAAATADAYSQAFADAQATTEEAEHIPPYQSLLFIERLDNSA